MSEPYEKAVEWARLHHPDTPPERVERIARLVHTPALGMDRSVCLRDVVEAMRAEDHMGGAYVDADFIADKFGGGA